MTLIGASRWRVELRYGGMVRAPIDVKILQLGWMGEPRQRFKDFYVVSVEPVQFIGKQEFREAARLFRSLFMNFERKWRWIRSFFNLAEARSFASALAQQLGELAYVEEGQICLVTPREEP